ncbi:MAG: SRPBCC family protein [Planctomycetota bacterium]
MTTVTVQRLVAAPAARVFAAACDIASFPEANPDVLSIEFLTEQTEGVGTRFRETRTMNGKPFVTELEVTEHDPEAMRLRMVSDVGGTVWDTVFRVVEEGGGARIEASMDCRAHKLMSKLLNPLMKPLFRRGMEKHMDGFQRYCEGR